MTTMLESGKVKIRGGQFIDLYNQQVYKDIAGTITTRVDQCSHYWVTVIEDEEDISKCL